MVISDPDTDTLYKVPEMLEAQGVVQSVCEKLKLDKRKVDWASWKKVADSFVNQGPEVRIAMVGKYVSLADSYVSVNQALLHSSAHQGARVHVSWVDAEEFEKNPACLKDLHSYHGILIPGGFGKRGSEGKIIAANFALKEGIPYLGLCFGFQLAVTSFARHKCGLEGANSTELNPDTPHPVIALLPEQREVMDMGATMHLGGHEIRLVKGTKAHKLYGSLTIRERHRHRYELNPDYKKTLESKGIIFSGSSDGGRRAEILEILKHPFYMATQYHPEFISRPGAPEPVYVAFISAAKKKQASYRMVHSRIAA